MFVDAKEIILMWVDGVKEHRTLKTETDGFQPQLFLLTTANHLQLTTWYYCNVPKYNL